MNETNRSSGVVRRRIFTAEEWSRINRHLIKMEKMRNENVEKMKTPNLIAVRPSGTLQPRPMIGEQVKKKEMIAKREPAGSDLTSDKSKEEVIERAKKILFENKDYARRLLHGLKLSTVLHERNRQVDLNRRLRTAMHILEREIKQKSMEEAKNYEEELMREKSRKREKKELIRKALDKQIFEKMEKRRREELEKAAFGKDIVRMNEELKSIMAKEREEKLSKKEKLKEDIENYTKSEREIRAKSRMKEEEEEAANEIYRIVAAEVDKRRRDRERIRFRRIAKAEMEISKESKEPSSSTKTDRCEEDERSKWFSQRKKTLLDDLLAGRKMAEEEMERRRKEENSARRRSAIRRRRKEEADRSRHLKEMEEHRKRMNNTRNYLTKQRAERKEMEKAEKEMEKYFAPNFKRENQMIGDYCDEVIELVNRNRRPLFPVAAAVKDVKKNFGIETNYNPNFLKSNVPIGK